MYFLLNMGDIPAIAMFVYQRVIHVNSGLGFVRKISSPHLGKKELALLYLPFWVVSNI